MTPFMLAYNDWEYFWGGLVGFFVVIYLFIIILALASLALTVICIVDACGRQWPDSTTKILWIVLVILGGLVPQILYFVIGRKDSVKTPPAVPYLQPPVPPPPYYSNQQPPPPQQWSGPWQQ